MLSQLMDVILFPVGELLKLLVDERISSYLGVSVLGIAVTCACAIIVVSALVNRVFTFDRIGSSKDDKSKEGDSLMDKVLRDRVKSDSDHLLK